LVIRSGGGLHVAVAMAYRTGVPYGHRTFKGEFWARTCEKGKGSLRVSYAQASECLAFEHGPQPLY